VRGSFLELRIDYQAWEKLQCALLPVAKLELSSGDCLEMEGNLIASRAEFLHALCPYQNVC
jgi:hypothetical protein